MQKHPNIAISGNPGVGKTTLAKRLAQSQKLMRYIDFGKEAIERGCHDGWDEDLKCHIIDYDALAKQMGDRELQEGGCIIDWIHADFWPIDGSINLVVTLTCDNTVLYDRYQARGYDQSKINENLDSEIMEEIVAENQRWFGNDQDEEPKTTTLVQFNSETEEDLQKSQSAIEAWIKKWYASRITKVKDQDGASVAAADCTRSDTPLRRVSVDKLER